MLIKTSHYWCVEEINDICEEKYFLWQLINVMAADILSTNVIWSLAGLKHTEVVYQ